MSDGAWVLHVDRRYASGNTGNTNAAPRIAEEHYEPTAPREYEVVVSQRGQRVTIGDTPWIGERIPTQSSDLMFDLTEGAFAGGRFVVWQAAQGLQGELTLYGSGVPIAQSERGTLTHGSR